PFHVRNAVACQYDHRVHLFDRRRSQVYPGEILVQRGRFKTFGVGN
ncbi:MAG: hypothetical protein GY801_44215, partial [bacterium]|nr:hypothetical protein [bacterium]